MKEKNKSKYNLSERSYFPSLNCKNFYGNFSDEKQNEAIFDRYVRKIYETEEALQRVDPYDKEPLKKLTDKVNSFLQRHAGLNYEEFVKRSDPYNFDKDDYSTLQKKALKRRLFDHRAYLYLSALDDCEREGADVEKLLKQISQNRIPFIKKGEREPTFDAILAVYKKNK